jgi:hypothetical protein
MFMFKRPRLENIHHTSVRFRIVVSDQHVTIGLIHSDRFCFGFIAARTRSRRHRRARPRQLRNHFRGFATPRHGFNDIDQTVDVVVPSDDEHIAARPSRSRARFIDRHIGLSSVSKRFFRYVFTGPRSLQRAGKTEHTDALTRPEIDLAFAGVMADRDPSAAEPSERRRLGKLRAFPAGVGVELIHAFGFLGIGFGEPQTARFGAFGWVHRHRCHCPERARRRTARGGFF